MLRREQNNTFNNSGIMGGHLSRLSINQATVRPQCSLSEAVDLIAEHQLGGIGVWRDKIAEKGVLDSAQLIRYSGLTVSGLCRAGMFLGSQASDPKSLAWAQILDDNFKAVNEACEIGADCLVVVAGGKGDGSRSLSDARKIVVEGLAALLEFARSHDLPVAIEPLHPVYCADRSVVSSLSQALDICDALGDGVGVAIDAYHVWWDPELREQMFRAGKARILAVHLCDWLLNTRDPLLDRGMMGDGVIDLVEFMRTANEIGYEGKFEVEIFSEQNWWKKPPELVIRTCIDRYLQLVNRCGESAVGESGLSVNR